MQREVDGASWGTTESGAPGEEDPPQDWGEQIRGDRVAVGGGEGGELAGDPATATDGDRWDPYEVGGGGGSERFGWRGCVAWGFSVDIGILCQEGVGVYGKIVSSKLCDEKQ